MTQGLIILDDQIVEKEMLKLLIKSHPQKTEDDNWGQKNNLENVVKNLNNYCDGLSAELNCYACIETYPPQSEIKVQVDSAGTDIFRIIDILTPNDDVLLFRTVHQ